MKTLDELKDYYRNGLKRELQAMENQRRNLRFKYIMIVALVIGVTVTCAMLPAMREGHIWIFAMIGLAIVGAITASVITNNYKRAFKNQIVSKLVTFLDPGLSYNSKGFISEEDFESSRLFSHRRHNRFTGEDLVEGTLDGRKMRFSELRVSRQSGGKNNSNVVIFKGLFLVADIGKRVTGSILLLPQTDEMNLPDGKIGDFLKGIIESVMPKPPGTKITLDHPEFDARFAVHAESQEEARELLDADLRARILAMVEGQEGVLSVSFYGSNIYLALSTTDDMFEAKSSQSVLSYDLVNAFFRDFTKACDLVAAVPRR